MNKKAVNKISDYIKKQNKFFKQENKAKFEIEAFKIIENIKENNFDFEKNLRYKKAEKYGKKRLVAYFSPYSAEFYLSKYLAKTIKNKVNLPTKNPHLILESFLKSLQKISCVKNFTLVMFDFKNFYNSISSEYAYKKALQNLKLENNDKQLIKKYVKEVAYCFAGLPASNIIAEVLANKFKVELAKKLKNYKLINIVGAGDDFALILNMKVEETLIKQLILKTVQEVFFEKTVNCKFKNKTKVYLEDKFAYISSNNLPSEFNYFGYRIKIFKNNNKVNFKLGISTYLQQLYFENLKQTIKENYHNKQKLLALLKLNTKRFVYTKKSISEKSKIVSLNYIQDKKLLRKYQNKFLIETENFLKNAVVLAFKNLKLEIPKEVLTNLNTYNLYQNLFKNRATVLNYKIGLKKDKIIKLLKDLEIDASLKESYPSLQNKLKKFIITRK